MCGAGGDEGPSSGVLFEWDHRTAADQWVRMPAFISGLFSAVVEEAQTPLCLRLWVTSPSISAMNRISSLPAVLSCLCPLLCLCLFKSPRLFLRLSYRKIPGDQCEGGFQPDRKETDLRRMCTSNALYPNSLVSCAPSEEEAGWTRCTVEHYLPGQLHIGIS